jgi:hypothetical protein
MEWRLFNHFFFKSPAMLAVTDVKPPLLLETIANVIFMLDVLRNFVTAVEVKGSLLVGVDPPPRLP